MNHQERHRLPHIKGKRFYNSPQDSPESFFFHTIPSFAYCLANRQNRLPANQSQWCMPAQPLSFSVEPIITWIGHSSFLIQMGGINILTDPVFGDLSFLFPRVCPPGIMAHTLPPIDIILLSHNHRDHCDLPSLNLFKNQEIPLLVPLGDKGWLNDCGFNKVFEHTWWEQRLLTITKQDKKIDFACTFLPAQHWSGRGLFDHNKSLWGSWMIQWADKTIYFAGDTAYWSHFKSIGAEFKNINIACMPIGPCEPTAWQRKSHVDPAQSVQGFIDLQAHEFIPMHWGTFQFGQDKYETPIERLQEAWQTYKNQIEHKKIHLIKMGQPLKLLS
jgi:N-acyl-phosphatidylethanolamine-hydrolysing phospholipase D